MQAAGFSRASRPVFRHQSAIGDRRVETSKRSRLKPGCQRWESPAYHQLKLVANSSRLKTDSGTAALAGTVH
jgi:hypothetical protein